MWAKVTVPLLSRSLRCNCLVGLDLLFSSSQSQGWMRPSKGLLLQPGSQSTKTWGTGPSSYSQNIAPSTWCHPERNICCKPLRFGAIGHSAELSNIWILHLLTGKRQWLWFWTKYQKVCPRGSLGPSWPIGKTIALTGFLSNQNFISSKRNNIQWHLTCRHFAYIILSHLLNKTMWEIFLFSFIEEEIDSEFDRLVQGHTKDDQDLKQVWNSDKICILSLTSC